MKNEKKTVRKQLLIKPSQNDKLKDIASVTRKSFNVVVGEAIDNYIKSKMKNDKIKNAIEALKEV